MCTHAYAHTHTCSHTDVRVIFSLFFLHCYLMNNSRNSTFLTRILAKLRSCKIMLCNNSNSKVFFFYQRDEGREDNTELEKNTLFSLNNILYVQ